LEERNNPFSVPAKIFVPLTASERTSKFVRPESTLVQLSPLLVERKTPLSVVPANRFEPETAKGQMFLLVKPELIGVQLFPLLVERNTPAP